MTLDSLVTFLSRDVGFPVLDLTELKGNYAFSLRWTSAPDDALPSLTTAVQEQLGLRLESRKVPIDTIVVDHAEKPSVN